MKKYSVGLVIGRFQPFHKGHLYLIKKAINHADKIIIAIGSSNKKDGDNPLSYKIRTDMLRKMIEHEHLEDKVLKIVPSPDDTSDEAWLKLLFKHTGKFDIEIGNNDWTNDILEANGIKVLRIPYYKRDIYQGIFIRNLFKEGKNWQTRVPYYLVKFVEKNFKSLL